MKRRAGIILSLLLTVGCWDAYRRDADLQVDRLVRDRQQQTIGYAPQAVATTQASTKLTRKSYDSIPTTPAPPATAPAIEPSSSRLAFGPLGPEELYPSGTETPRHLPISIEEARRPALERLRLGPPAVYDNTLAFDLFQTIQYAVQHGRDYQTQMEDLYLAALSVTLERHTFEPQPFDTAAALYNGGQRDYQYRSALNITNAVGVRQNLPFGGNVMAEGLVSFVNALNDRTADGESAQLVLSGTLPLLRGFGPINLEALIEAERTLVYTTRNFELYRRNFAVSISTQYFNLLTLQSAIANRRINYVFAYQLTEQSNAMYAAGRAGVNYLSVQRAESQLYSSENSIIEAEDNYQSSLDNFKLTLGMPIDQPLNIVAVDLDIRPPDLSGDISAEALRYRLDLQTAADQIEDARRGVDNARNGLLPSLNLTGSGTLGNRADTPAKNLDSRNLGYNAGVTLDLPLDQLPERNVYRQSLISLERAQRNWAQTRDSIINQVRNSGRAIRTAQTSLDITSNRLELAKRRLDYANELLVLGRATDSRDSVEAENELLDAQDTYQQALATYRIQVLSFLRDEGTLRLNPDAGSLGLAMQRENSIALP